MFSVLIFFFFYLLLFNNNNKTSIMSVFSYNPQKCTSCGTCSFVCPLRLIKMIDNHPVMPEDNSPKCISCGQCTAFCPYDACQISISAGETLAHTLPYSPANIPIVDGILESRRSYRTFAQRPVARSMIEEILKVAHMAPTAKNTRNIRWVVLDSPKRTKAFIDMAVTWLQGSAKNNENFCKRYNPDLVLGAIQKGGDPILKKAPCTVFTVAPKTSRWGEADCAIACTYFNIAAEARNIGCTFAGIAVNMVIESVELQDFLGIKPDEKAFLGLFLGYKTIQAHRIPGRGPMDISYV